ncbi:MAG: peptidoglycan DD-metalloendopeptidase family protein [Patescibacteria group bacterium]
MSSIFGNSASAGVVDSLSSAQNPKNSQTIALLQADVSFIPILQDKKDKSKSSDIRSNIDVNIVSENALFPATSHMSVLGETEAGNSYSDQISVYVVRKGDSVSQIADMFDVSIQTILAANDMKKSDKIKEGDVLFILPVSGLEHTITKGQTLKNIAKLYKVDVSDITQFNGITEDTKLTVGDKIMIPGGEMMDEGGDKPASNLGSAVARDKNYYDTHPIQNFAEYFINPVPTGRKTQGLHGPGNRGIDIGAPKGTPIYASASGTVLIAKTGWSGGYGSMIIIQHSNETKTLYAHMSKLGTRNGAQVSQGEIIGYVGSTGRSTGPHIHFEVFNAKNPGADWSWAN